MPKVAIFFLFLLISPIFVNSHAFPSDDFILSDNSIEPIIFDSDIIDVDSNFFVENNFKRYLIFGSNSNGDYNFRNNSLYGIESDHGFFSVSVLSPSTASNLISQGYTVIEDSKLDFHSNEKIIPDVSRIGEITVQQYLNKNTMQLEMVLLSLLLIPALIFQILTSNILWREMIRTIP